jgi:hypothetical protein
LWYNGVIERIPAMNTPKTCNFRIVTAKGEVLTSFRSAADGSRAIVRARLLADDHGPLDLQFRMDGCWWSQSLDAAPTRAA